MKNLKPGVYINSANDNATLLYWDGYTIHDGGLGLCAYNTTVQFDANNNIMNIVFRDLEYLGDL